MMIGSDDLIDATLGIACMMITVMNIACLNIGPYLHACMGRIHVCVMTSIP